MIRFLPGVLAWCLVGMGWVWGQTVTLEVPDAQATESGVYPGVFRLVRTGDVSGELGVNVISTGTATPGKDYEPLQSQVVIPAGSSFVEWELEPINDPDVESVQDTVMVQVAPGVGYTVGQPSSGQVEIVDNETFTNTAPLLYKLEPESSTSIRLYWTDNFENETKYRIQYRSQGTTAWTTIDNLPPNTTTHVVGGLVTGQPYEFRVVTFQNSTSSLTPNPARAVPLVADVPAPEYRSYNDWLGVVGLDGPWRQSHGRSNQDPDRDSKPNFLEYLLGSDPWMAESEALTLDPLQSGLRLSWFFDSALTDGVLELEESVTLAGWTPSPLSPQVLGQQKTVDDTRGGTRFYRLVADAFVPVDSFTIITCWGDSLTGNPGTYATKLPALLGGRAVQNGGIGGDTSIQIGERLAGVTLTSPYPSFHASLPAGTPLRIVASRTTHARLMNAGQRSNWPAYASTLANVTRVEFFNLGHKIGESSSPLQATVTTNRAQNPTRFLAAGHPFQNGDVVHFPGTGLPSPLVSGKPYYIQNADSSGFSLVETDTLFTITASQSAPSSRLVSAGHPFTNDTLVWFRKGSAPAGFFWEKPYFVRDADAGGFSLAETLGGPAITTTFSSTGNILGPPGNTLLSVAADLASPTLVQGPFALDWVHPGGPLHLTLRTHTDRDQHTVILWMGRNNNTRPHEVYDDLHAAVRHLKVLNARFLIVSLTNRVTSNGTRETAGNSVYYNTINLNALLKQEFPDQFIDVRTELIRAAPNTPEDQADRADDIPPVTFRSAPNDIHFNDAGQQLIAEILAGKILKRGW